MNHAVRCPRCRNLSRVGADALDQTVACPHCGRAFTAKAEPSFAPPQARRVAPPPAPVPSPEFEDDVPTVHPVHHAANAPMAAPSPGLIGLVLVPFGIPLLWLVAPILTGRMPVFSFAAPVALAIGLSGLGLGVAFAQGWTVGTRVRAALALILVGYFTGGFLYFMKKEWAESIRKGIGPSTRGWSEFSEPREQAYKVKLPGRPIEVNDERQMPGWALKVYRFAEGRRRQRDPLDVTFEVAHGTPPRDVVEPKLSDDEWFAKAREAVLVACEGTVDREQPLTWSGQEPNGRPGKQYPGREYVLGLPGGATNRIVRVYRAGDRAYYLAVEGTFVPDDAEYVVAFFSSFSVSK